jgi:copper chaperone CopZ
MAEIKLKVSGMKCNGCETRAKEAVAKLAGYEDASFDHKTGTGIVRGELDPKAVIAALSAVGYQASVEST